MTTPTNPTPTVSDPLTTMDLSDITNGSLTSEKDWEGTGIFDVLMNAVNKNITTQYEKSRINSNDFANVYLGSIQAVLQQSIEYSLRKDLTAAQIDGALKDNLIKDEQLLITSYEREHMQPRSLEKLIAEVSLTVAQVSGIEKDNLVKDEQITMSVFEREFIQPKTLEKLDSDILMTSAQISGINKDNEVKDEQILMTTFERVSIQPKTLEKMTSDIGLTSAQVAGIEKDNLVKDEQVTMSVFEREFIQPATLTKIASENTLIESNTKLSYTDRIIKDKTAADLGLDQVVKTFNTTPPAVYTPQYKETP